MGQLHGKFKMVSNSYNIINTYICYVKCFILVGPAGRIVGPNVDVISVTCKPNILQGKLPAWVSEPPLNKTEDLHCIRFVISK